MTRTVSDTAILLGVLTGIDPREFGTEKSSGKQYPIIPSFSMRTGCVALESAWRDNFLTFSPRQSNR